jgi:transposase
LLLPPDLREWLPEGYLALFISDVVDELDLSPIYRIYERTDGRGQPAYRPAMMVKLLLYGYCTGTARGCRRRGRLSRPHIATWRFASWQPTSIPTTIA